MMDLVESLNIAHRLDEEFSNLNEASNKWLRAIKEWIQDKEAASIVYQWYDNENAFEDFDNVDDFVDYAKDDVNNMLDAAGVEERKIVAKALGIDTYDDEDERDTSTKSKVSNSKANKPFVYNGESEVPKTVKKVVVENGVTSIAERAFRDCSRLTSITLPNSVTSIGDWAFDSCENLTSINIPDSVTSIGDFSFSCCYKLNSITIPNSVISIGDRAFSSWGKKKYVTFHCSEGSHAHKYALENDIPVKLI